MNKGFTIAIDGPVASGKGTIAPKLAERLNGMHLYTGGTYRAVALYCLRKNVDLTLEDAVLAVLPEIKIDLIDEGVFLNGEDVTEVIKKPEVADSSSVVSVYQKVREEMVGLQQRIAQREIERGKIIIAEGRDTGTKVFPDAEVKIYLTANPEVRAKRRYEQYKQKGVETDFAEVLRETLERDKRDTERRVDPLVKNPKDFGYGVVDNSYQSESETIDIIVGKIKEKGINL